MRPTLGLVPIGLIERSVLEGVGQRLEAQGFDPRFEAPTETVRTLVGPGTRRLQALSAIPALRKQASDHVLGLTEFAVTDGVKEWIYGMGEVNGRAAVFSAQPFRQGGLSGERFLDQLSAAILHELAHNVGMVHCRNKGCLMNATHEPAAMRQLGRSFCETCGRSWARRIRKGPAGGVATSRAASSRRSLTPFQARRRPSRPSASSGSCRRTR